MREMGRTKKEMQSNNIGTTILQSEREGIDTIQHLQTTSIATSCAFRAFPRSTSRSSSYRTISSTLT